MAGAVLLAALAAAELLGALDRLVAEALLVAGALAVVAALLAVVAAEVTLVDARVDAAVDGELAAVLVVTEVVAAPPQAESRPPVARSAELPRKARTWRRDTGEAKDASFVATTRQLMALPAASERGHLHTTRRWLACQCCRLLARLNRPCRFARASAVVYYASGGHVW